MSTPIAPADCRFCSLVSQANGEDPIGSANPAHQWLIIEQPLPWAPQQFSQDPQIQPIIALIRRLALYHGIKVKPILIAPDRDYSQPDYRRILYYTRPATQFHQFEQQEYLVPADQVATAAIALLRAAAFQTNHALAQYRQPTAPTRDILVCTHGNVDVACARFGFPIYEKLRQRAAQSTSELPLRVWRCSHFGGHQYAPTLIDLPSGRYWGHVQPEMLDALVDRQGSPTVLYPSYRGWAGLAKFEQIAEREIWMQVGWDWLDYDKRGEVLRLGEPWQRALLRKLLGWLPVKPIQYWLERSRQDARWAEVRIHYHREALAGYYDARVEIAGEVMTAIHSSAEMPLVPVYQYRVRGLKQSGGAYGN
jgi:hypothetical protein